MRALFAVAALAFALVAVPVVAQDGEVVGVEEQATHEQGSIIKMTGPHRVNAFCLDRQDRILAACGEGPGEVQVLDAGGKLLTSWEVSFKPEAIHVASDGTVLVGGQGKLMRFTADGKMLQQADSPHAIALRENSDKLREQARELLERRSLSFQPRNTAAQLTAQLTSYERILAQLKSKQESAELSANEQSVLRLVTQRIEQVRRQQESAGDDAAEATASADDSQVAQQVEALTRSKLRVASISSDGHGVFVATPALVGYTFDVWRLEPDFSGGEVVVSELRGCCGQMDVQACASGIYVAENSRHRVAVFASSGSPVTAWGQRDRSGVDGFTSCCNPMNVCFGGDGDVYTAESSTGRIKRFASDGTFKAFVGDVKLVPGCKNVSIAVSADDQRVYMLDITRNHIVVMRPKSARGDAPAQ